jgi:hypothetical protein
MQDGRAEDRRELFRRRIPPLQQLEHQPRNSISRERTILPDPDSNHPVLSGLALIHHLSGKNPFNQKSSMSQVLCQAVSTFYFSVHVSEDCVMHVQVS